MGKAKYLKYVIAIMLMVSLCGCTKSEESKVVVNTNPEKIIDISSIGTSKEDYQSYWGIRVHDFAKGQGGYYYMTMSGPLYLMFFDEANNTSYPVCGKADCNHDSATCNAFLGDIRHYDKKAEQNVYYSSGTVYYYQGYIYVLSNEGYLVRITPDGSVREKIAQVYTYEGNTGTKLAFYDDYVYVYDSIGHLGDNKEYTETIKRYSLDGKTQDTIFEYTGSNSAIVGVRNHGDRMFFLVSTLSVEKNNNKISYNYTYTGLYAYNHKTQEMGKVIDAEITDYYIDEDNNTIYYYVVTDGLYKLNVSTKENNKIYDATDENGIVDLSFDGKYIYMYNGIWSSDYSTDDNKISRKCWVISDSGKLINTISFENNYFCYFGDDKYIFADHRGNSTENSCYAYIDKSIIETATEWVKLSE